MRRPYDHDCFIAHQPIVLFAVGFTFIHTLPAFHILGQAHAEFIQLAACGPFLGFVVHTANHFP